MTLHAGLADRTRGVEDVLAAAESITRAEATNLLRAALNQHIDGGEPFTVDDVRATAGNPDTHHPNVLPALIAAASRHGRITATGLYRSRRRPRHGGVCMRWIATQGVHDGH